MGADTPLAFGGAKGSVNRGIGVTTGLYLANKRDVSSTVIREYGHAYWPVVRCPRQKSALPVAIVRTCEAQQKFDQSALNAGRCEPQGEQLFCLILDVCDLALAIV